MNVLATKDFNRSQAGLDDAVRGDANAVRHPERLARLDFIKGALVWVMLAYHCGSFLAARFPESSALLARLHFIHPAFLFIAGMMVGLHYRPQAIGFGAGPVRRRLLGRGLRLCGLFLALNAILYSCGMGDSVVQLASRIHGCAELFGQLFLKMDGRLATAEILWIIGLFLILSGLLIGWIQSPGIVAGMVVLLGVGGMAGSIPAFLCIGMAGVLAGTIIEPASWEEPWRRHPGLMVGLAAGWLVYLPLTGGVVGICERIPWGQPLIYLAEIALWFAVIFGAGQLARGRWLDRLMAFWGRYTLFAYCLQLALIRFLCGALAGVGMNFWGQYTMCLALSAVLLHASLWAIDRLRLRSKFVDRLYRIAF